MKDPTEYYDKERCGENEYELYRDIHQVLKDHAEIWAVEPRYVLMSAIEGLFEVYFPTQSEMFKAFDLVKSQIVENSRRPIK